MKKIAFAAMALAALVGFMGCDTGSSSSGGSAVTVSDTWYVKGPLVGGWSVSKYFTVDELDATKLSYEVTGLYDAVEYEFALVSDTNEFVCPTASIGAVDAAITAGSKALGAINNPTGYSNFKITATKSSYTIQIDITDPSVPVVTVVSGSSPALEITEEVLANGLKLKGSAFDTGWSTELAGTYDAATKSVTYQVKVASKDGEFGLESAFDGFVSGTATTFDLAALTTAEDATTPVAFNAGDGNSKVANPPKDSSTYNVVVTIDLNKTKADGRYMLSFVLVTLSDKDWTPIKISKIVATHLPEDGVYLIAGTFSDPTWTADPSKAGAAFTATAASGTAEWTFATPLELFIAGTEFKILRGTNPTGDNWDNVAVENTLKNIGSNAKFSEASGLNDDGKTYVLTWDASKAINEVLSAAVAP